MPAKAYRTVRQKHDCTTTACRPVRHATGGIYNGRQSDNWFGRGRSYQVGDVITVLLNESAQAARQQSRNVSRESSNDVVPSGIAATLAGQSVLIAGMLAWLSVPPWDGGAWAACFRPK